MRILAINIRAGGSQSRVEAFAARCAKHDPDVLVISEYRDNAVGARLRAALEVKDLNHQGATEGHRGNGVLIAARRPFKATRNPFGLDASDYPNAVLEARFDALHLFGVYLPGQDRKRVHLRCLIAAARRSAELNAAAMAIGDFNSGRNASDIEANVGRARPVDEFSTADLYAELETYWTEAWLHCHPGQLDYSWYPFRKVPGPKRRNGWRIDKAFVSPAALPRVHRADYDHGFRTEGLTDHSALIVDLAEADSAAV
ncbi:MAG TPA: endonuclease/exonuclease/phosphatase family protein [Candidatus Tumulicola sp.]